MGRCRFDIIASMLRVAEDTPSGKTRIMYQSNLSFKQLTTYLAFLTDKGLLTHGSKYEVTEKGRRFLEAYDQMNAYLG